METLLVDRKELTRLANLPKAGPGSSGTTADYIQGRLKAMLSMSAVLTGWKDISIAPKLPQTGCRGPIIIGIDKTGLIGRTSFVHDHPKGGQVWLLHSGEGLMEWNPVLWVEDPVRH